MNEKKMLLLYSEKNMKQYKVLPEKQWADAVCCQCDE